MAISYIVIMLIVLYCFWVGVEYLHAMNEHTNCCAVQASFWYIVSAGPSKDVVLADLDPAKKSLPNNL